MRTLFRITSDNYYMHFLNILNRIEYSNKLQRNYASS